jgi:hypothetical protein
MMEKVYQMRHRHRFMIAMITLLVLATPYRAAGFFMNWRPFIVREDLAPVKKMRVPAYTFKHYVTDSNDRSNTLKAAAEGREIKWSEFQFGSFRLRISRYQDLRLKSDSSRSNNADGIWETVKSLPAQLGNSPYRDNLETMGKIFAPQFDFGIEF